MALRALTRVTLARTAAASAAAACAMWQPESCQQAAPAAPQKVFCWGMLPPCDVGETARELERSPVKVPFWSSQDVKVVKMSYGANHGAALDDRGRVWAWGRNAGPVPQQLPTSGTVASIASTDGALYAVSTRGKVMLWEDPDAALATDGTLPPAPPMVGGAVGKCAIKSIAAGADHVIAVGRRGELFAWGDHSRGQLGIGESQPPGELGASAAVRVPLPRPASQAACGWAHSVILLDDGSCVSFGDDRNLQLGLRSTSIKDLRCASPAL